MSVDAGHELANALYCFRKVSTRRTFWGQIYFLNGVHRLKTRKTCILGFIPPVIESLFELISVWVAGGHESERLPHCDKECTVLAKRLEGSFHCTDLGFSLFDAKIYGLFDGVIFKIDVLKFFKIYSFF